MEQLFSIVPNVVMRKNNKRKGGEKNETSKNIYIWIHIHISLNNNKLQNENRM